MTRTGEALTGESTCYFQTSFKQGARYDYYRPRARSPVCTHARPRMPMALFPISSQFRSFVSLYTFIEICEDDRYYNSEFCRRRFCLHVCRYMAPHYSPTSGCSHALIAHSAFRPSPFVVLKFPPIFYDAI